MNTTKSAMITVCGRPNVGKSTLCNALVGEKIAIVSNKPQTTRNRITAIVSRGDTQFVLLDTPGFHKPHNRLGDYMVNVVKESVAAVDAVMLLVEPVAAIGAQEQELIARIAQSGAPSILVINKIDTVEKTRLLEVMAVYSAAHAFDAVVPISAATGEGLGDLLDEMEKFAEEGPHLFPDDMITDQPERQICAELVREKLLTSARKRGAARHGCRGDQIFRAGRRHHRPGCDDLLREGESQGDHYRQKGSHAQKNRRACAPRYRDLYGYEGIFADLGKGQGELARQPGRDPELRVYRGISFQHIEYAVRQILSVRW